MAYILAQAAAYMKVPVTLMAALWDDAEEIDAKYISAVDTVYNLGVIRGRTATTFAPKGLMTRVEAVTVLVRMCRAFGWID